MTILTQTSGGNWSREVTISAGGKWRKCTQQNVPLAVAEHYAAVQIGKGRKTEIRPGNPCEDGQPGYQVWAYISRNRVVMVHASRAECEAAGKTPGKCNE